MGKPASANMEQLLKVIRTSINDGQGTGTPAGEELDSTKEYTVDQLANAAETTVRTIRNYQDKGLLAAPRLQGRKGYYSHRHLSRLKLIGSLIERGFAVNAIRELLNGLEQGLGLDEFLGVESALTSPWSAEEPQYISIAELYDMFPDNVDAHVIIKAQELGVFSIEGKEVRVNSMKLLEVAQVLTSKGLPLSHLLDILERTQANVQQVANDFVKLVSAHILEPYGESNIPPREVLPELTGLVWELRPLAEKAVIAELARAMGEAANTFLADKLSTIFSKDQFDDTKLED